MANTITIVFATCSPTPANGYLVRYRPISGGAYRTAPNATTSPIVIVDTDDADGTQYEGYIQSDCGGGNLGNQITFETEAGGGSASDSGADSSSDSAPDISGSDSGSDFFFSFVEIPFSDPDLINYGRGAELWGNGSQAVDYPEVGDVLALNRYSRYQWSQLETALNTYDWTDFDDTVKEAIDAGMMYSFGIMTVFSGADDGNVTYDGFGSSYPEYLHDLMQGEAANDQDYEVDGWWIPNFNSTHYLGRLRALNAALYDHIQATSYVATAGPHDGETINFADVIYCVDVRGFGQYGEWHTQSIAVDWDDFPTGRQPTIATLKEIIDLHTEEFPDWPNQIMIAAYDSGSTSFPVFHPYPEVGLYAIQATNAWGACGWRRDQWGDRSTYLDEILINNAITFGGSDPFGDLITAKYLTAPVTGEPAGGVGGSPPYYSDIEAQVETYHATSYGNGNWGTDMTVGTEADLARAAFKTSGFRWRLNSGGYSIDSNFNIDLQWDNIGIAPTYENWGVYYELRNGVTIVWSEFSSITLKLAALGVANHSDAYAIGGVPSGTFDLYLIVGDPLGYKSPMRLAIEGRGADGAYLLGAVTIP